MLNLFQQLFIIKTLKQVQGDDRINKHFKYPCLVNLACQVYKSSKIPAAPCPVPTHMVTIPYFLFCLFSSFMICTVSFAPVQPSGCPNAIAPPFTLITSGFKSNVLITANYCEAKASFSSIKSISSFFKPACFNALGIASIGPIPIMRGGTPAIP